MQEWALCLPGTFPRLGPHTAALHALHVAFKTGLLKKEPSFISTSSVAAIPASIAIQRSEERFVLAEEMLINLRKRQFVSLNPGLKRRGAIDFISILGLLLAAHQTGKIENLLYRYSALLSLGFPAYQISKKAIKDIFNAESFLVYDNLHKLLLNSPQMLDFDLIFNSPIKIEIPAVNMNKAGWTLDELLSDPPLYLNGWKNKGWVSVTNFRPEDINLEATVRNEKYVAKLINGLRVYGQFPPGRHENDDGIVDTAALSNLPVHFAINQGYSNIVVLHYNSRAEGPTDRVFKNWIANLNRCCDLNVSELTRKAVVGYLRVNNDLDQLAKQKEGLKRLEELLYYESLDSKSKAIIREYIQNMTKTIRNLSYANKKKINFIFVGSDPLPDAHFSDFTQDQMLEGINIGWKAGLDSVPKINKMISD